MPFPATASRGSFTVRARTAEGRAHGFRVVLGVFGLLLALFVAPGVASADYRTEVQRDNPTAWWPLNEASGTTAFDIAGGPGQAAANATYGSGIVLGGSSPVPGGGSATFGASSTSFANIATTTPAKLQQGSFSIEAWFKSADTTHGGPIYDTYWGSQLLLTGGHLQLVVDKSATAHFTQSTTATSFEDASWHHVLVSYNGSNTVRINVDGVLVASTRILGTYGTPFYTHGPTYPGAAEIGDDPSTVNGQFHGQLADVAYYNQELGTDRAAAHYAAANVSPANSALPVLSGTPAVDQTLTTTNGAWSGSPSFGYQWLRDGQGIGWANDSSYTLTTDDVGHLISVRVSATSGSNTSNADSASVAVAASYAAQVIADGASGYWRLGEAGDQTAYDLAGQRDGLYGGGLTYAQASYLGGTQTAVKFDGTTGEVVIPDAPPLSPSSITVEAFVKFASTIQTTGTPEILYKDQSYAIRKASGASGTLVGYVQTASSGWVAVASTIVPQPNTTYHVALTYNASGGANNAKLYVDGVLAGQATASGALSHSSTPLSIGSAHTPSAVQDYLSASVDDVSLFPTALSQTQLLVQLADAGMATPSVTIPTAPASPTQSSYVAVPFTAPVASLVTCSLDGATAAPCATATFTRAGLAPGSHSLAVSAANGFGTDTQTVSWIVASQFASAVRASSPSYYYRFDEPSSVGSLGIANQGSLSTNSSYSGATGATPAPPGLGDAFSGQFNGTSGYVTAPAGISTLFGTPLLGAAFSVEAWVRTTNVTTAEGIFGARNSDAAGKSFTLSANVASGGSLRMSFFGTNLDTPAATIAASTWYLVDATYNGTGTGAIYVNGVLAATGAVGSWTGTTTPTVTIGRITNVTNFFWSGSIDEFAAYPATLTSTQIATHYTAASGFPTNSALPAIRARSRPAIRSAPPPAAGRGARPTPISGSETHTRSSARRLRATPCRAPTSATRSAHASPARTRPARTTPTRTP